MKYGFRVLLGAILAVAIVFVMLRAISWQDTLTGLRTLRWTSIAIMIGAVLTICVVKATRFFLILRFGNINASWLNTLRIFIASQAFTPMPAGELGRALLFKKELDTHLNEVAGPVFLQALLELWTATFCVIITALFVASVWGWFAFGFVALLAILTIPLLCSKSFPRFFNFLKRHGMTYAWIEKTQTTFHHFATLISSQGKHKPWRFWLEVIGLGLLVHISGGGLMWYIADAIGAHITLLQGIFAAAMATLIQGILTVIPGGLGVTEGGLVGVLSSFAVPWQQTVVITLLYRVATLPFIIVIAILFLIPMYGKKILRLFHAQQPKPNV